MTAAVTRDSVKEAVQAGDWISGHCHLTNSRIQPLSLLFYLFCVGLHVEWLIFSENDFLLTVFLSMIGKNPHDCLESFSIFWKLWKCFSLKLENWKLIWNSKLKVAKLSQIGELWIPNEKSNLQVWKMKI
jgi:hypothetical protein